jgi:hypothetical protein
VTILTEVIYRTAGFEYLQRLMAIRAQCLEREIFVTGFTMSDVTITLERFLTDWAVEFHINSFDKFPPTYERETIDKYLPTITYFF